jgi:hypothetical protein
MILYCPDDSSSLEATGRPNFFLCLTCRCIFEVRVTIVKASETLSRNELEKQPTLILASECSVVSEPDSSVSDSSDGTALPRTEYIS